MGYARVIPRDLFNEAKLLKCLGFISLCIHDGKIQGLTVTHEDEREGFKIAQDPDTGAIFVTNLYFFDENGAPVFFVHPLNSKLNFPLIMSYKDEEFWPFNEKGDLQILSTLFKKKLIK
jgi:hypothetical protein